MAVREISLALSLVVVPCSPVCATATLTVPVAQQPVRLPDETPGPEHPPHGEGSGELPTFAGISASGAMSNVSAAVVTTTLWEPMPSILPDPADRFSHNHNNAHQHHLLKQVIVTPPRAMIRIRRSC